VRRDGKCDRCKRNYALHEWSLAPCSLGRKRIVMQLCNRCDVAINYQTLVWMRHPKAKETIDRYKRRVYGR
jgi:hypothetical protein